MFHMTQLGPGSGSSDHITSSSTLGNVDSMEYGFVVYDNPNHVTGVKSRPYIAYETPRSNYEVSSSTSVYRRPRSKFCIGLVSLAIVVIIVSISIGVIIHTSVKKDLHVSTSGVTSIGSGTSHDFTDGEVQSVDFEGRIRITSLKWVNELGDHAGELYQVISKHIQTELDQVFELGPLMDRFNQTVVIDLSPGSVVVDFIILLNSRRGLNSEILTTIALEGLNKRNKMIRKLKSNHMPASKIIFDKRSLRIKDAHSEGDTIRTKFLPKPLPFTTLPPVTSTSTFSTSSTSKFPSTIFARTTETSSSSATPTTSSSLSSSSPTSSSQPSTSPEPTPVISQTPTTRQTTLSRSEEPPSTPVTYSTTSSIPTSHSSVKTTINTLADGNSTNTTSSSMETTLETSTIAQTQTSPSSVPTKPESTQASVTQSTASANPEGITASVPKTTGTSITPFPKTTIQTPPPWESPFEVYTTTEAPEALHKHQDHHTRVEETKDHGDKIHHNSSQFWTADEDTPAVYGNSSLFDGHLPSEGIAGSVNSDNGSADLEVPVLNSMDSTNFLADDPDGVSLRDKHRHPSTGNDESEDNVIPQIQPFSRSHHSKVVNPKDKDDEKDAALTHFPDRKSHHSEVLEREAHSSKYPGLDSDHFAKMHPLSKLSQKQGYTGDDLSHDTEDRDHEFQHPQHSGDVAHENPESNTEHFIKNPQVGSHLDTEQDPDAYPDYDAIDSSHLEHLSDHAKHGNHGDRGIFRKNDLPDDLEHSENHDKNPRYGDAGNFGQERYPNQESLDLQHLEDHEGKSEHTDNEAFVQDGLRDHDPHTSIDIQHPKNIEYGEHDSIKFHHPKDHQKNTEHGDHESFGHLTDLKHGDHAGYSPEEHLDHNTYKHTELGHPEGFGGSDVHIDQHQHNQSYHVKIPKSKNLLHPLAPFSMEFTTKSTTVARKVTRKKLMTDVIDQEKLSELNKEGKEEHMKLTTPISILDDREVKARTEISGEIGQGKEKKNSNIGMKLGETDGGSKLMENKREVKNREKPEDVEEFGSGETLEKINLDHQGSSHVDFLDEVSRGLEESRREHGQFGNDFDRYGDQIFHNEEDLGNLGDSPALYEENGRFHRVPGTDEEEEEVEERKSHRQIEEPETGLPGYPPPTKEGRMNEEETDAHVHNFNDMPLDPPNMTDTLTAEYGIIPGLPLIQKNQKIKPMQKDLGSRNYQRMLSTGISHIAESLSRAITHDTSRSSSHVLPQKSEDYSNNRTSKMQGETKSSNYLNSSLAKTKSQSDDDSVDKISASSDDRGSLKDSLVTGTPALSIDVTKDENTRKHTSESDKEKQKEKHEDEQTKHESQKNKIITSHSWTNKQQSNHGNQKNQQNDLNSRLGEIQADFLDHPRDADSSLGSSNFMPYPPATKTESRLDAPPEANIIHETKLGPSNHMPLPPAFSLGEEGGDPIAPPRSRDNFSRRGKRIGTSPPLIHKPGIITHVIKKDKIKSSSDDLTRDLHPSGIPHMRDNDFLSEMATYATTVFPELPKIISESLDTIAISKDQQNSSLADDLGSSDNSSVDDVSSGESALIKSDFFQTGNKTSRLYPSGIFKNNTKTVSEDSVYIITDAPMVDGNQEVTSLPAIHNTTATTKYNPCRDNSVVLQYLTSCRSYFMQIMRSSNNKSRCMSLLNGIMCLTDNIYKTYNTRCTDTDVNFVITDNADSIKQFFPEFDPMQCLN